MKFSALRRPQQGEAITASLMADILAAGQELGARAEALGLPSARAGRSGAKGRASVAPPPLPRLSLLAPCLITGGQLDRYRPVLSLLGDIELPPSGGQLAPWYAVWCSSPRAEGGEQATTAPRNEFWVCTAMTPGTKYHLMLTCDSDITVPDEVWYNDTNYWTPIKIYGMHGVGADYPGLDIELMSGEAPIADVSAGYFSDLVLGSVTWENDVPVYAPSFKLIALQ